MSSYISECVDHYKGYNDKELVHDEKVYQYLLGEGIKAPMAKHVAHLFIRDTVSLFSEKVTPKDEDDTDHFENIQSTNWQAGSLTQFLASVFILYIFNHVLIPTTCCNSVLVI